jgi:arylsulfatase A-like enzyme
VRWPGVIEPGTKINDIISHLDSFPAIAAALGDDDIKEQLQAGTNFGSKKYRVHLDGYNFLPYFKGETTKPPRNKFFYLSDTGDLLNIRYNQWKIVFAEQREHGLEVWGEPISPRTLRQRAWPLAASRRRWSFVRRGRRPRSRSLRKRFSSRRQSMTACWCWLIQPAMAARRICQSWITRLTR